MVSRLTNREANSDATVVRRNFVFNVLDGALFAFGLSLVSNTTVLPVFVKRTGGSNIAIGLIPVLWTIGFNFPQIFVANYTQRFPFKKGLFLRTALVQRVPWLLLALISFFVLSEVEPAVGLLLFFVGFALAAIGGSLNLPVWFDLISKITPVRLRGRLFATRAIVGATLGILGGFTVKTVLDTVAYPRNFAILFTLAFCLFMVSYVFLLLLQEKQPNQSRSQLRLRQFICNLPAILKRQRNFRNFLVADALLITALAAEAFYTVNAFERFSLSSGYAGHFTMVMMASMIAGNFAFGYLADHLGHKLNLLLASTSTFLACSLALFSPSVRVYYVVFVFVAFTLALNHVSRLPIIAELCSEEDRPTYVALTNIVTSPFILFGIFAGWVADRLNYDAVFVMAGLAALASALWLLRMVKEPRRRASTMVVKAQIAHV